MSFYDKQYVPPLTGVAYEDFPVSEANCVGMRMLPNAAAHLPRPLMTQSDAGEAFRLDSLHVNVIADLHDEVYASRSGEDLIIRWAVPKHNPRAGKPPVLAYVEGSGWGEQWMSFNYSKLGLFLENGWVIASIKHRSSMRAPFPAHLQDAKTGLRFIRTRCGELGFDGSKIVLWGCSSGGHTVSLLAVTRNVPELDTPDYADRADLSLCGVIDCFGPTALHLFDTEPRAAGSGDHPGASHLFGDIPMSTDCPEVRRAEPESYITPETDIPPMLILHGSKDMTVPLGQSVMLYQALIAAGKDAEFYCVDRAGHERDGF